MDEEVRPRLDHDRVTRDEPVEAVGHPADPVPDDREVPRRARQRGTR
ncbi:hypothetical protein [Amycolatopsis taiwanensis]|nr:hypothetical protein [Amycolatopsis taiwanensis]